MKLYIQANVEDLFPESNPRTSPEMLREFAQSSRLSDKRMVAYNPSTPPDVLIDLMNTKDDIVRSGIYHNPNVPAEVKQKLYEYFSSLGKSTMRAYHIAPMVASKSIKAKRRICASTTEYELDQFVGKDIWVKCVDLEIPDDPYYFWYRINSKDTANNTYQVNFLDSSWVTNGEVHCNKREYKSFTSDGVAVPIDYLEGVVRIATPLELYSTEDFFVVEPSRWDD